MKSQLVQDNLSPAWPAAVDWRSKRVVPGLLLLEDDCVRFILIFMKPNFPDHGEEPRDALRSIPSISC